LPTVRFRKGTCGFATPIGSSPSSRVDPTTSHKATPTVGPSRSGRVVCSHDRPGAFLCLSGWTLSVHPAARSSASACPAADKRTCSSRLSLREAAGAATPERSDAHRGGRHRLALRRRSRRRRARSRVAGRRRRWHGGGCGCRRRWVAREPVVVAGRVTAAIAGGSDRARNACACCCSESAKRELDLAGAAWRRSP
jgi:hypothetical protein